MRFRSELFVVAEESWTGSKVVEACAAKVCGITVTDFSTYFTGAEVALLLAVVEPAVFCGGFVITTNLSVGPSVVSIVLCKEEIEFIILSMTDLGVPNAMSWFALCSFFGIFCMVVLGICVMSILVLSVVACVVVVGIGVVDVISVTVVDVCEFFVNELMICSMSEGCFSVLCCEALSILFGVSSMDISFTTVPPNLRGGIVVLICGPIDCGVEVIAFKIVS